MRLEKHRESLKEVVDEIETALEDPEGLMRHQRRLALMLSLGVAELVEAYFHKLGIMKSGARIKHTWFKRGDLAERLESQITGNLEDVESIGKVLGLCKEIEEARDDVAYGSPLTDEKLIKEKVDQFLEVRSIIEGEVGDILE